MGLATNVAADPRAAALDLASSMAVRSPEAVRSVVRLLRTGRHRPGQDGPLAEREDQAP